MRVEIRALHNIIILFEYVSRVNKLKNVVILGHAVTDVSLMMMVLVILVLL